MDELIILQRELKDLLESNHEIENGKELRQCINRFAEIVEQAGVKDEIR